MRQLLVLAVPLLIATKGLVAQAAPSLPIPAPRDYGHAAKIEKSYADDEKSTSVFLTMPFDEGQRKSFVGRNSKVRDVHLDAGFVHPGWVMTTYPDVVTLVLKVVVPPATAQAAAPLASMRFAIDGRDALNVAAPLVNRAHVGSGQNVRGVEDTYVIVLSLNQFLELVNGRAVTASLDKYELTFTGAPLEGMRDLASRIVPLP